MTAQEYLNKLESEKNYWKDKVDSLPGDSVSVTNPFYIRSVNAANKYASAKFMMKLMQQENESIPAP